MEGLSLFSSHFHLPLLETEGAEEPVYIRDSSFLDLQAFLALWTLFSLSEMRDLMTQTLVAALPL